MSCASTLSRCVAGPSRLSGPVTRAPIQRQSYATGRRGDRAEMEFRASIAGFKQWAENEGKDYAYPSPGGKAKWLGGSVPFPTNPSFRPPPPLSNAMQDRIYQQLVHGGKDLAALASEYNVSKSRILAIKKLKEVEAEFRRQSLPLQTAFQDAMEPLLDMKSPIDPATGRYNERHAREESRARASDVSHQTELDEEQRFESGHGAAGSFGDPVSRTEADPIERVAWEWRDESFAPDPEGQTGGESSADLKIPVTRQPLSRRASASTHPSFPAQLLPSDGRRTAIRFIDVSGRGLKQTGQVAQNMSKKTKIKDKRRAARAAVRMRETTRPRSAEEAGESS